MFKSVESLSSASFKVSQSFPVEKLRERWRVLRGILRAIIITIERASQSIDSAVKGREGEKIENGNDANLPSPPQSEVKLTSLSIWET